MRSKRAFDSNDVNTLVKNVDDPKGLAVDWLARNLYFINGLTKNVHVIKIENTTMHKNIISDVLEEPTDMAVDPYAGRLFISDYGHNAKIWSASMDGSDLRPLVESKLLWPSSLAIGMYYVACL